MPVVSWQTDEVPVMALFFWYGSCLYLYYWREIGAKKAGLDFRFNDRSYWIIVYFLMVKLNLQFFGLAASPIWISPRS